MPPEKARPLRGRFSSVEINTRFYRLPAAATVEQWRDAVPEGFVLRISIYA